MKHGCCYGNGAKFQPRSCLHIKQICGQVQRIFASSSTKSSLVEQIFSLKVKHMLISNFLELDPSWSSHNFHQAQCSQLCLYQQQRYIFNNHLKNCQQSACSTTGSPDVWLHFTYLEFNVVFVFSLQLIGQFKWLWQVLHFFMETAMNSHRMDESVQNYHQLALHHWFSLCCLSIMDCEAKEFKDV